MVTHYRTVAAPVTARYEDRRSVFECWLRRADDEDDARAVVEQARATHWDARHHCSAFVLGPDGATTRSSDDGEPSGTAGAPMLDVLSHSGFSDIVAVVTRWFGGTLLGAGGLVRAYSEAVRLAVEDARPQQRALVQELELRLGHAEAGRLEHELRAHGVGVLDVRYDADVTLALGCPVEEVTALSELVARLTGGRVEPVPGVSRWRDVPVPP